MREIFESFGPVSSVELAVDKAVNISKGYGYIEYENGYEGMRCSEWEGVRERICEIV